MNLKIKLIKSFTSLSLLLVGSVYAQVNSEEAVASKLEFDGSVDTYFRSSFSKEPSAPNSSFADLNGFSLGMANFVVSYKGEKSGVVADIVFGPRGSQAILGSIGNSSEMINQLFVYYSFNSKVKLTLGNFNTFLGYELISPVANFNYSTSYMFSYGPFSHTGIKADFILSENSSLMLGIFNKSDQTEANYDRYTAFGAHNWVFTDSILIF